MKKLRKTLGAVDAPYIVSLMRLIETQSKATLANWAMDYAEQHLLPIYADAYPNDTRPQNALAAAREWLAGQVKLPYVKKLILDTHAAAREAEAAPAAQAAVRAIGQATSTVHSASHSLGMVFYGAAAMAYARVGLNEKPETYERIAAEECAKMEAALRQVSVANEQNPTKINWNC